MRKSMEGTFQQRVHTLVKLAAEEDMDTARASWKFDANLPPSQMMK